VFSSDLPVRFTLCDIIGALPSLAFMISPVVFLHLVTRTSLDFVSAIELVRGIAARSSPKTPFRWPSVRIY